MNKLWLTENNEEILEKNNDDLPKCPICLTITSQKVI